MMFHPAPSVDPDIDRWRLYLDELSQMADRAAFLRHERQRRERLVEMRQILERAERYLDQLAERMTAE